MKEAPLKKQKEKTITPRNDRSGFRRIERRQMFARRRCRESARVDFFHHEAMGQDARGFEVRPEVDFDGLASIPT